MKKNILLIVWFGITCLLPATEFMKLSEIRKGKAKPYSRAAPLKLSNSKCWVYSTSLFPIKT
jgi:threonine/homoserine/homoserine lactone efflux protein